MMTPIFLAKVSNSTLQLQTPDKFRTYLYSLKGQQVEVVVRLPRKDRSTQQNKWYWKCIVGIVAEHFGYLPEEMHQAYKLLFLRMHEEGKPKTVRSTTQLSTVEFSQYTEKCQHWAAEQGIIVPSPNEVEL